MKHAQCGGRLLKFVAAICALMFLNPVSLITVAYAADHNDPNAVNSIFSNIEIDAADLYGMFGYPGDDKSSGETVVIQLTFAPIPETGVFDRDLMYRIKIDPDTRKGAAIEAQTFRGLKKYAKAVKQKYAELAAAEVRVTFSENNEAKVSFIGFHGGDFSQILATNEVLTIDSPDGHKIKAFLGGRDDPFFNDLPGFFRSVNYGPQFYHIPTTARRGLRELPIPKTLLELEGNSLFNFDAAFPRHGRGMKKDLPDGNLTWQGDRFLKDANGNYRFVYSGEDAQAERNVNAIALEMPLDFITDAPDTDRIVRTWGESYVLKASGKVPDARPCRIWHRCFWIKGDVAPDPNDEFNDDVSDYKLVDTVGVPFLDAGLSEREDRLNVGANNIRFTRRFVKRLGHLGWGFGPSITALGLGSCFDHGGAPVSVHKRYWFATPAFKRGKKCVFQELNMPDVQWKAPDVDVKPLKTFEIFVPNVTSIDMDTNGTWPYGRRLEDQVASRFLSIFLDMENGCGGRKCDIESLQNQALWDSAPIDPKTPPNPLANDKPFLDEFPYLAEPW